MGQLADAKARLSQATAEEEQNRTKLTMSQKEMKALEARWKAVEREAGEGMKNLEIMRRDVEALRKKVEGCGWSEEKEQQAEMALRKAKEETRDLAEVGSFNSCSLQGSLTSILPLSAVQLLETTVRVPRLPIQCTLCQLRPLQSEGTRRFLGPLETRRLSQINCS